MLVQRQFNVELMLDWRWTDICRPRLFIGEVHVCEKKDEKIGENLLKEWVLSLLGKICSQVKEITEFWGLKFKILVELW